MEVYQPVKWVLLRSTQLLTLILVLAAPACAQHFPHVQAHAHNDYEHSRPLLDALDNGFVSIEADVHLVDNLILVSHDRPTDKHRTLEKLYLRPLDSIARKNNAWVYAKYRQPMILMIDIKTPAAETFDALKVCLLKYKDLLSTPSHDGPVKVVISGNRSLRSIQSDTDHLTSIDGRPEDLGHKFSAAEMPVVSESYQKVTGEKSSFMPSKESLSRINDLAARVHAEGKKLRLWAIPDNEKAWQALLDAGVDIINTDKLQELHTYLTTKQL